MNITASHSFTIRLLWLAFTFDVWFGMRKNVLAILVGTVGAGIGISTTFTQQFYPQVLFFTTATPPDINIKVSGDGTPWDVPGLGVNEFATVRQLSRTANFYMLQLGNGLMTDKTTTYTITNQTAAAFDVFADSTVEPVRGNRQYFCANSQVCLAASGFTFRDFMYLSFANAGATDTYNVTYRDRTQQPFSQRNELKAMLQFYQNSITTVGYNFDNWEGNIKTVQVTPAAQQTAYVYYKQSAGTKLTQEAYKG